MERLGFKFSGIICFLVSLSRDVKSQEVCTNDTLGNFPEAKHTDFPYGGLFVDIYNRVPCDSNVFGWQICFFPPSDNTRTYTVELSVFKYDTPINGILYLQRPESVCNASFRGSLINGGGGMDNCRTINLPGNRRFEVKQDEFIGVYIGEVSDFTGFRDGDILDIIGNTTNGTNSIAWRCPRQDNTIISAFDTYTSCFGRLDNHLIQARLLMSISNGNGLGTGNDSTTPRLPTIAPNTPRLPTIAPTTPRLPTIAPTTPRLPTIAPTVTQLAIAPSQFINVTDAQQKVNILVPLSVVGACLIIILIASIISVLIVIIVHHRRKAKLEMMRWRKERRNIMPDHFVIVSEQLARTGGELPSNAPQPYEDPQDPQSTKTTCRRGQLNSLTTAGQTHFENLTYESEDEPLSASSLPRQAISFALNSGDERLYSEIDAPSVGENEEIYESIDDDYIQSPPPHIKALYSVIDKNNLRKSSIAGARESGLYEHYYRTLEKISTLERTRSSIVTEDKFTNPASSENDLLAQFEKASFITIPSKEVKIMAHLGTGQFGEVNRGMWKNGKNSTGIAVKRIVDSKTEDKTISRVKLLQEAIIMGQFTNPNVIHFYGMVIAKDRIMLVMELAAKGDLEHLLLSMVPDPGEMVTPNISKVMLGFCQQVAFGMHYLSSKGFVHRDLAARNILVTQDNVLKIADFGMSRDLAEDYYMSQGGKIPVKWTAPEAIHYKKYSTASDVWAYGCLLYEIWSLGQTPFRDYSNTEAMSKLQTGYRLSPPPGCPRLLYDIMIQCWNPEPSQRTQFKALIFELLEPETKILHFPEEDASSHQLAEIIGGPLEAGENMYLDLQTKYLH